MRREVFLLVSLAGAAVMAAGVLLDWMSVSVLFADGTRQAVTATGLEMFTEYSGRGMPIVSIAPVLFLVFAAAVVCMTVLCWIRRDYTAAAASAAVTVVMVLVMLLIALLAVDSTFMMADTTGTLASEMPGWVTEMFGDDVYAATVTGESGRFVSAIGTLVSSFAMFFLMRGYDDPQGRQAVEEGYRGPSPGCRRVRWS